MRKFAAVLLLVSGCSVALQSRPDGSSLVHGAPADRRAVTTECTTGPGYWIVDTVIAVAAAGASVYGFTSEEDGYIIGGSGALGALLFGASAHNGYKWARECRELPEPTPAVAATDFSKH